MKKTLFIKYRYVFLIVFFLHFSLFLFWVPVVVVPHVKEAHRELHLRITNGVKTFRQIVQSEDPETKTTPTKKSRLSDKDRSFDRETKARVTDSFQQSRSGVKGGGKVSLSRLGGEIAKTNPFERAARQYSRDKTGDGGTVHRSVSSTNDYLEEIPLGELTHLNTVEYKFYGYFYRIRQKLEGFWGRSIQEKAEALAMMGRSLKSDQHVTALRIVMNSIGEIVDVIILGSSGVKELDDAAIESFNAAGPFPNPPKDLIIDDRVTIEWGFVVNS